MMYVNEASANYGEGPRRSRIYGWTYLDGMIMHKVVPRLADQLLDGFSLGDESIVGWFFFHPPFGG
jgi:hypothetical protein